MNQLGQIVEWLFLDVRHHHLLGVLIASWVGRALIEEVLPCHLDIPADMFMGEI